MEALTPAEIARYSRHLLLPQVGAEGQARLKASSVAVIGAGGLGSPALLYLAAAGVGRIGVVDHDKVDVTNLQRQVVHDTDAVGEPKTRSAAARIRAINPHVEVIEHQEPITSGNALRILAAYDVVIDGTDNFPTRYLVNDACVLLGKPYVYGSIFQFEGQASVFNHQGGPHYRDLFPEPPAPGSVPSCGEAGVLGVLPAIVGSIQATEALKILLGIGDTLSGRLLVFDALAMTFREIRFSRDLSLPPVTRLVDYEAFCGFPGRSHADVATLSASELRARMAEGWSPVLIDVRSAAEAATGGLPWPGRVQPHDRIAELATELPRDRPIVLYCGSGSRSRRAAEALGGLGFGDVYSLEGGMSAWRASA
jgi:adenylyltransferase/sulfurtransferase